MSDCKKIAVIGAGPSGLSVLHAFKNDSVDITVFEKQADMFGQWNMDWHTGVDANGEVVHGSMYNNLYTNAPREGNLEFPDAPFEEVFGRKVTSFPPRELIVEYLKRRYATDANKKCIKFQNAVRDVKWVADVGKFRVRVTDLVADEDSVGDYDYVFNCVGHYSSPKMVEFPGFGRFQGRLMHAHDFKDGGHFKGQTVMTIGSSYSAEDIATHCVKYGAEKGILCSRAKTEEGHPWDAYVWPETGKFAGKFLKKPNVKRVEGKTVVFEDDSTETVDSIIVCTGYRHHYPFMAKDLRLGGSTKWYDQELYMNTIWKSRPELMYIGAQTQAYSFIYFEMQAKYCRDVVMGNLKLPTSTDQDTEWNEWILKIENVGFVTGVIAQREYMKHIAKLTHYCGLEDAQIDDFLNHTFEQLCANKANKVTNMMTFRDQSHVSWKTKTLALASTTPWMEMFEWENNDSL